MRQSVAVRNARLNAIETAIGTAPILQIRSGSTLPATEGAAATGTLLASLTLPSNWLADAASGAKALAGSWVDSSANASGTPGHYELFASDGTTRHLAGSCSGPSGGGELVLDSDEITSGQEVTVTSWTITAGNAW